MNQLKTHLSNRHLDGRKSLAVLIDPDKVSEVSELSQLLRLASECYVDYIFIGGSHIMTTNLGEVVSHVKSSTDIPVILFPGNAMQIDKQADGILFLSLISGRNPEFLIGQHVVAAPMLKGSDLEILPTGYILINDSKNSSVAYVSNTTPIPTDKYAIAASTAMAGEMLGMQLIYMDAGSGSSSPIPPRMISSVRRKIDIPLIVGGGINSLEKAKDSLEAGADIIVIGNAIEKNPDLMIRVSEYIYARNAALDIH
jgi:putative glycerol-1-phosphate prenyltransferase